MLSVHLALAEMFRGCCFIIAEHKHTFPVCGMPPVGMFAVDIGPVHRTAWFA
jgi:hypothetical protein